MKMRNWISRLGGCAVGAVCLLAAAEAKADIKFCSEFPHKVFVAIAYPQDDGSWISRGWLELNAGECSYFDTALQLKTFYYRGESVPFREGGKRIRNVWGGGDKVFAIWDNSNFNYWNAQTKVLNSSLAAFSKGVETIEGNVSITVTFEADGKNTSVSIHPVH